MGIIQETEVRFVGINKETGKLSIKTDGNANDVAGISGILKDVSRKKSTLADGTELDKLIIQLQDDELYQLQFGFTSSASRNIINSLLGTEKTYNTNTLIRCYKKNGFNKIYLEIDGKGATWKYEPHEIPKTEILKLKSGKETKDESLKEDFYENIFKDLLVKFTDEKKNNSNSRYDEDAF